MKSKNRKKNDLPRYAFTPDYLRSGEELFFPLFIAKEDSPEEYRNRVSWMNVTLSRAASLTLKDDTLAGNQLSDND